MNTNEIYVRPLTEDDADAVYALDEQSSNQVSDWIDVDDYAYGVFKDDECVGYCTIGGADDVCREMEQHIKAHGFDSWDTAGLLSDVFVSPSYRGQGLGTILIKEAIKLSSYKAIYCEPLHNGLISFYEGCGFAPLSAALMLNDEKAPHYEVFFNQSYCDQELSGSGQRTHNVCAGSDEAAIKVVIGFLRESYENKGYSLMSEESSIEILHLAKDDIHVRYDGFTAKAC